ncbi:MAG: hypothetical protein LIO77_09130 [Rikenellaceae bacterium]|nr:hypothetical protein [Rikenellaceae bacterium]
MQNDDKILFSRRFQSIYEHLGTFSYLYIGNGCKGINRDAFVSDTAFYRTDTQSVLYLLENHQIIFRRDGLLHLNCRKFFHMTMWDLLLLAEPWLNGDAPPGEETGYRELIHFARSEKLCSALSNL